MERQGTARTTWIALTGATVLVLALGTPGSGPAAQDMPRGRGQMMGMMGDPSHMGDMQVIHELLASGAKIRRAVTARADGIETVTESDDPAIATKIQGHVAAMYARVKAPSPIHMHDPLFRAVFEHASQITMAHELTANGIKVVETSTDPYVVKLIQAHAEVLNLFIKNGMAEAMKSHEVPARDQ